MYKQTKKVLRLKSGSSDSTAPTSTKSEAALDSKTKPNNADLFRSQRKGIELTSEAPPLPQPILKSKKDQHIPPNKQAVAGLTNKSNNAKRTEAKSVPPPEPPPPPQSQPAPPHPPPPPKSQSNIPTVPSQSKKKKKAKVAISTNDNEEPNFDVNELPSKAVLKVTDLNTILSPNSLLSQKRRLKKINRKENFAPVKLYRREFFQNLDDQDPEFLPILEMKSVIIKESLGADITQLHFSGIEQMTDFMFYILLISKGNFENVTKLVCTGCIHLTDQGMKWASELFPALTAFVVDGCSKITEKSVYHMVAKRSNFAHAVFSATDVACIPPEIRGAKFNQFSIKGCPVISMCPYIQRLGHCTAEKGETKIVQFGIIGCPVISMCPYIERIGVHGAKKIFEVDSKSPYQLLQTHKTVIITDTSINYSIGSLLGGKSESSLSCGFNHWKKLITSKKGTMYNVYEVSIDNPVVDSLVSEGSIVVLPYAVASREELPAYSKRLALSIAGVLCKCPYVMFILVGIEDSPVSDAFTTSQLKEEIMDKLLVWRGGVMKEIGTITLRDWRLEQVNYTAQILYASGVQIAEEIGSFSRIRLQSQSQKMKNLNSSCIGEWLDSAVDGIHADFEWIPKELETHCFQAFDEIPRKIFSDHLSIFRGMKEETLKLFKTHECFPLVGKLLEFLEKQGGAIFVKDEELKHHCVTDIDGFKNLVMSVLNCNPPSKADVPSISDSVVPVWTETDLKQKFSSSVQSDEISDLIEFIIEMNLLVPVRCEIDELDIKVCGPIPRVYIPYSNIPSKPAIDLLSLYPETLPPRSYQREKIYTFLPGLPASLFPTFLRKCGEIFRFTLLWKTGALIQHGPVDVFIELTENKHKYFEHAPVIAVQGRIALWDQLVDSNKENTNYDGKCLWTVLNTITTILDSVCVQLRTFALITIPCLTCVPDGNRNKTLANFSCYHFNYFVFLAGFDRGMSCKREGNAKFVRKPELTGEDMPSIVPYHNYSFMMEANNLLNKDDSLFPCGVPTDPFGEKQCWKCFNCWRKDDLVCHHCGMCQQCITFLAKIDRIVKPGYVASKHYNVKDFNQSTVKNTGRKKAKQMQAEEGDSDEETGNMIEKDIDANALMSGCLISLLRSQELRLQQCMNGTYFNELSLVIITGKQFVLTLEVHNGKTIEYNASCGIFMDQEDEEHKELEYKAHTGDLFTLKVVNKPLARSVVYFYLRQRLIYHEEVDACQIAVSLRTGLKASYIIHSPGIKMTWQYTDAVDFKTGMKVEVKNETDEMVAATIDAVNNGILKILPDNMMSNNNMDFQVMPESVSVGRVRREIGPRRNPNNDDNDVAPPWLFNQLQLEGRLTELLKGRKARDLVQKCTNFLHPSVLHAQMTCFEPEIEDVIFRQGGIDFSGTALLLFPQNLKEKDLFYPSNLLLTQQLKCQPLCYQRGDMNSVMTFRHVQAMSKTIAPYRTVHIMNNEGFIYESSAGGIDSFFSSNFYETMILWAWHLVAMQRQEPVELELSAVLKEIKVSSLSKRKLTNAIYRLIQRMSYHLYFGLGPTFDPVTFNKDNSDLNSSAKELESMLLDEFDKSGLKKVEIMFSEDQVYMCETHAACWQINKNLTEIPLNLFTNNTMYIKSLHLQTNQIESVPDELFTNLPCIMDLDISSNKLKQIPDSIVNCTKLLTLVIYNNELTTLPNSLASCKCLERLDISKNLMKEFPPVITKLSKLTRLYAQNMQLTDLPEDIGNLTRLDKLGLNGNCFTSLPKSFSNLKNLTELFMNGVPWYKAKANAIISKEHFEEHLHTAGLQSWLNHHDQDKMSIFKYFDEDTNGTLDQKELGKLNATMFNVFPRFGYKGTEPPDDDMPSGFPTELLDLPKLSYLGLQFQGFISIPEQVENLISLTTLNVSHNPNLLSIPAQLGNLPLKRLEMDGCPSLKTPPKEIRAKGFATTFAYLRRLLSGSTECMRTKLMLVGLGGAGKTSLVKALLSDDGRTKLTVGEDITDGIDICPWKVKTDEGELTFSVWDFAGQTVYYNTHQFFLSDRAVYLLLWNIRLGHEHAGLDFWLSSISVHAPKAPIFIVGTHADQVAKIELPTKAMLERYPQITGFHYISSHTGQGVNELKTNLVEETLTQQYMGEKIPGVWLGLEKSLQEIQEKCVIEYSELEKRANTSGIFDKSEVSQALQFLHELGSLQYFQNEFLKKHVVISPQWIVDVMACVVSVKDSAIKEGRLHHDDISKVWSRYPENLHWWLLRLTEEFDLTFRLADEPINIVPCLLPEKQPVIIWPEIEKNSSMKETKMVYKFDYLPAGLFNRGQVRLHQFSDSALIWKRGSFLKKNEHICLLQQTKESELVVRAQGARPDNVLFLVHEVFEGLIAESFHGVTYDFFIPCPDCQKQMLKDPHMFAASTIRRASELKAPFLQCLKYFHTISIIDLQAFMPPDSNLDYDLHLVQAVRGLKELTKELATDIFMSYCAQDVKKIGGDCVSTKTIVTDIRKAGYKCWYKEDGSAYTSDEMARALIDSSVFVALISNDYVKDETCCNLFKYARLTLRKPIIIIAIGDGLEWKQSKLGILLVDEVFVDMRKMERYKHKLPELLKTINSRINRTVQTITSTPCFISYCWQNSQEAINKGSRVVQGAIGAADPRDIKVYLEKNNIKCWIDVERAGNNGLFDDIAEGLINADVMVACVSDEYSKSSNCQFEFRYAVNTLKLPIVLAIVGTGNKWRASEIGILSLDCPMISFQEKSETGLPKLLEQVKNYLPEKEEKKKTGNKQPENKEKDLSFQELFELAQRKFLRQIMQYAEKQDILPYPRLFVTDFIKQKHEAEDGKETVEKEKKDGLKFKETQGLKKRQSGVSVIEDDTDFHRQKYTVNILCESDEGWHSCCNPLPLPDDFGTTSLEKFSPYIARITAISKYNKHMLLNCLETEEGQKFLKWLEESPQIAAISDFEQIYYELRQEVMQADVDRKMGSLSRCHLPNGKTIWLCEEHQKTMKVTVLSNEVLTSVNMVNEGLVTDYMLYALRDLDVSSISAKFKERKRIGKKVTDETKNQTVIKEPEKAEKSASTSKTTSSKTKAVSSGDSKTEEPTAGNQEVQNTSKRPLTRQASKACALM